VNDLEMGHLKTYKISASENYFDSMQSLSIDMASTFGDADLRVFIDGEEFGSFSAL
jgi:hypothetical protein